MTLGLVRDVEPIDLSARRVPSAITETALIYAYRAGTEATSTRVVRCGCGDELVSIDARGAVAIAVRAHQELSTHRQWWAQLEATT